MQKHFRVLFFWLLVVLMFCRCSENTPLTPEGILQTELAYFPLQEGYKVAYKYAYSRTSGHFDNFYGKSETQWRKDGSFLLEVIESYTKTAEKAVFYKIRTNITIKTDFYYTNPKDTVWNTSNDSTVITEYEVMLKNGSLWYVDNAPDFEHLEQGDTTLMMASPIACGGEINLDLFPVKAYFGMPFTLYEVSSYDESLGLCGYYQYPNTYCNTVKNKGIVEIQYMYSRGGISGYEEYVGKLELIE